jgi:flagellar biosynthetic protein FliP
MMNRLLLVLGLCFGALLPTTSLAQDVAGPVALAGPVQASSPASFGDAMVANFKSGMSDALPRMTSGEGGVPLGGEDEAPMSTAVEIALILTVLSVLPALLITVTCFTRIVIVLSFVRRAMSINELPPNPVLIGLALFLTAFIMGPVASNIYEAAWVPYQEEALTAGEASDVAWEELSVFLLANTRQSEIELFTSMSNSQPGDSTNSLANPNEANVSEANVGTGVGSAAIAAAANGETPPMSVVIPAFILSELKTAFQMGFLLFLPFLVIDLVISSVLLSMGMFMLPPVMISTPFKILLFVLVDGWHLIVSSLVTSFAA